MLMVGDNMLYQTVVVPVGDDQRQHVELARNLAQRFNARFGETFKLPRGIYPEEGARIMDLQAPDRKMSTTGGTQLGTVYMLAGRAGSRASSRRGLTTTALGAAPPRTRRGTPTWAGSWAWRAQPHRPGAKGSTRGR